MSDGAYDNFLDRKEPTTMDPAQLIRMGLVGGEMTASSRLVHHQFVDGLAKAACDALGLELSKTSREVLENAINSLKKVAQSPKREKFYTYVIQHAEAPPSRMNVSSGVFTLREAVAQAKRIVTRKTCDQAGVQILIRRGESLLTRLIASYSQKGLVFENWENPHPYVVEEITRDVGLADAAVFKECLPGQMIGLCYLRAAMGDSRARVHAALCAALRYTLDTVKGNPTTYAITGSEQIATFEALLKQATSPEEQEEDSTDE